MSERLKQLLETEAELDALLASAKQRAQQLVDDARVEAEERVRRHEEELQSLEGELRTKLHAQREREIESIRSEAAREAEALDETSDERLDELARYVVSRLIGGHLGGGS